MFSQINLKVKPKEITMKFIKHAIIAGTLVFATLNVATAAPILNISTDGISTLLGASGVNVGGTFYDVTFADGIIDAGAVTAFTTEAGARAASQALLDQVLTGSYDTFANLTNGCTSTVQCWVITPYSFTQVNLKTILALNYVSESRDVIDPLDFNVLGRSTADSSVFTIARWAPVAAIPEPETYAMMLAGLGLLGFVSRRRKQKTAV